MVRAMSSDPKHDEPHAAPVDSEPGAEESGVIPVEVEAPQGEGEGGDGQVVEDAESKLAALEKEKKENWDRYLRAAADLENLRKRQKRELEDARLETKQKVLKEMLPVVDNLERAIEHAVAGSGTNAIVEGVQLVLRQLMTAFERLGVTPVEAMGQPFDPNLHEAISQVESEAPPGSVVQVLQKGYKSGDRLIRPALVVVAKAPAAAKAE